MSRPKLEVRMARCSHAALVAAVEIYNKPTVEYREQTFSMLITNAWEILLKSRIIQQSNSNVKSIYRRMPGRRIRYVRDSDTGEPITITLDEAIGRISVPSQVAANIRGLAKVRNSAMHLGLFGPDIRLKVLEYGTASVRNLVKISKAWFNEEPEIPYLLPVGFIGQATVAKGQMPKSQKELLKILDDLAHSNISEDSSYDVVLNVEVNLNRGVVSGSSIGITNDPDSPRVQLAPDEILARFPLTYRELVAKCRARYSGFKSNDRFNEIMRRVKANPNCAYMWPYNPQNRGSSGSMYYNEEQSLLVLDTHYVSES